MVNKKSQRGRKSPALQKDQNSQKVKNLKNLKVSQKRELRIFEGGPRHSFSPVSLTEDSADPYIPTNIYSNTGVKDIKISESQRILQR